MKIFSKTRKRNQNSYLLLAMFFLIFLIKPEISLSSNYIIGKIDTNISNRQEFGIYNFFYDKDSTIWMNRENAINYMKKGETKFTQVLHQKDVLNKLKVPYIMSTPHLDGFGNIITIRAGDVGMFDIQTGEYKYYKYLKNISPLISISTEMGMQFGDKLFLNSTNYGFMINYYMKYDKIQKKWIDDTSYYYRTKIEDEVGFARSWKYKDKLYIPYKKGLYILDPKTFEHTTWEDSLLTVYHDFRNRGLGVVCDEEKDIITIAFIHYKRGHIMRIYGRDSVKLFKLPYVLSEYEEDKPKDNIGGSCAIKLTALDKEKTKFIVDFSNLNLTYWSEEEGFKYIPPPDYITDTNDVEGNKYKIDSLEWLNRLCGFMVNENEFWIAGEYRYIYRLDINKMLEARTDEFRYKHWKSSVEDDAEQSAEQRFVEMDIYGLSPVPSRSHLNVKYYLTAGFGNLNIKIYDIEGKEYNDATYEIVKQSEITRTVRINLPPGLHSGVYMLHLEESGKTCSKKFVVE